MNALDSFIDFLSNQRPFVVLTGAGISAASGIPTYRNHKGEWQRSNPIIHQEFIQNISMQQRYWARSMVGWRHVAEAQSNAAHHYLALLEKHGYVSQIITQNVDGLHQRAGSKNVIDLHGRLDQVVCLQCNQKSSRQHLQTRLESVNPDLTHFVADILPDGDADIDDYPMEKIQIPECTNCGGALKPDVVFFGDNVPKQIVANAMTHLKSAASLLIVGSSLQVYSGYRFCKAAKELGIPIGCLNQGLTRADDLFAVKWQEDCADMLQNACAQIFDTNLLCS